MKDVVKGMNLPVTFETGCTTSWMGKRDADGNTIDERDYRASAYVFGAKVAETRYDVWYKTESAAIAACAKLVRERAREYMEAA